MKKQVWLDRWGTLFVTNALLALIAILLGVLVIRGSWRAPLSSPFSDQAGNPHVWKEEPFAGEEEGSPPFSDTTDFHPSSMVLNSLSCPQDTKLTLGDPACSGAKAEERRKAVEEAFEKNLPIAGVFDLVMKKFGENALTPKALEIVKGRGKS